MTIILLCTGRRTHPPVAIYVLDGPVPETWTATTPHSDLDLLCDRKRGGCGRAPRPGSPRLRALINGLAATQTETFDISYWDL